MSSTMHIHYALYASYQLIISTSIHSSICSCSTQHSPSGVVSGKSSLCQRPHPMPPVLPSAASCMNRAASRVTLPNSSSPPQAPSASSSISSGSATTGTAAVSLLLVVLVGGESPVDSTAGSGMSNRRPSFAKLELSLWHCCEALRLTWCESTCNDVAPQAQCESTVST
jgi:hypothetical protein